MRVIPKTSVGIEAAGQNLRIAVLRDFGGKRRLLRLDVLNGFAGLSEEDKIASLAAHFKRHKLSGFNVHLTLPGSCGISRDLEFPATVATVGSLRSAVTLQIENLSPWALDEIYWDCSSDAPAKNSRPIIAHIGIIPRAVLDPWIALFRSARLALAGASLSSLSWAHGVSVLWGTQRPAMVLAAENHYVEGALVRENHVYTVSVLGTDTAQLVSASASHLMRSGRLGSADELRLVSHGDASEAAGVDPAKLPVEGGGDASAGFGAVSAALLGLVRSGFRLNLIPEAIRHQRNHIQFVPTYSLIALLFLLSIFAWIREPYQQSLYAARLDQEAQRLVAGVRSVSDQEAKLNGISERLRTLDALVRGRDANLEALRELSRVLPQGTWITSYACQDNVVNIAGFSESAASIQKLLEDSPVFRDAQFTSSITRDASGKDRFALRASIEVAP